jgi:phage terminase large subunit
MHVDFSTLNKWINPIYYPYLWDTNRYNIFYGGAGSGKSVFVAQRYVYRFIAEKGHNILILRKAGKYNKTSTFPLIKQILNGWGLMPLVKINKTDLTITNIYNGNQILFGGLDDVEKLKSITFETGVLTDIWIEEASEASENDFTQLNLRLRGNAKVPFQITLSFNPISALHWIKARFFDDPGSFAKKLTILKTTYKDNEWLDEDSKEELEGLKDRDLMYYKIYALGEWGIIGNLVFTKYKVQDFDPQPQYFDEMCNGMDFGFNHPNVIERIGIYDGDLYFYAEHTARKMTNEEILREVDKTGFIDKRDLITADSAEPDRIKEWKDWGYTVRGAKKGKNSLKYGIEFLRQHDIIIHPSCTGILSELQTFKYKEDKDGNVLDEYVNFKDDHIAAGRYATEYLWHNMLSNGDNKPYNIGSVGI